MENEHGWEQFISQTRQVNRIDADTDLSLI